jgi:ACS family allantoate permease-like MFS transporter
MDRSDKHLTDDKDIVAANQVEPVLEDDASAKYSIKDVVGTQTLRDDDVEGFVARNGGVQTYSAESNKALLRKIDLHIMPLMMVSYCLQVSRLEFWNSFMRCS